jgi:hypothetical protein
MFEPARAPIRPEEEQVIRKVLVRMNETAWGIAIGLLLGVGLLLATIILVARGDEPVGPHLALLGIYFPGYSVSYGGSVVGFVYAFVVGYAIGRTIGVIYNWLVKPTNI